MPVQQALTVQQALAVQLVQPDQPDHKAKQDQPARPELQGQRAPKARLERQGRRVLRRLAMDSVATLEHMVFGSSTQGAATTNFDQK